MDVRVLGPLDVVHEGATVDIRGASARAVLAMLALGGGGTVLVDDIIDGLWAIELPSDPAAAVQVAISRLRRALGAHRDCVMRDGRGYALALDHCETDVHRAEQLLRRGLAALDDDAPTAANTLVAAFDEWRAAPLQEFADLPFTSSAVARLQLLRISVAEARNRALLACGRGSELIESTEELLRSDPWQEELVHQLMRALYESGRQTDALVAYAQLSSALRRDFDIEPSDRLQSLHRQMVDHDPALTHTPVPSSGAGASLPHWFAAALAATNEPDDAIRCRLLLALGEAQHYAGEPGWQDTLAEAGDVALRRNDFDAVAKAALGGALGWAVTPGAPDVRRLHLIDAALDAGDALRPAIRARLLAARATEVMFTASLQERLASSDEALALARVAGERGTLLSVLNQRFSAVWSPATLTDRRRDLLEIAELATTAAHPVARAVASGWQMAAAMECGELQEAMAHFDAFTEVATELDLPVLRWGCVLHASWQAVLRGDLDRADLLCREAEEIGRRANRPEVDLVAGTQRAGVRWAQGRLGEAADEMTGFATALPGLGFLAAVAALARYHRGETETARELLDDALARRVIEDLAHNQTYLATLVHWAELAWLLGHDRAVPTIAGHLRPYADQFVFTGAAVYGPVAHALAQLSLTVGDEPQAAVHLQQSFELADRMPAPFFRARALQIAEAAGFRLAAATPDRAPRPAR